MISGATLRKDTAFRIGAVLKILANSSGFCPPQDFGMASAVKANASTREDGLNNNRNTFLFSILFFNFLNTAFLIASSFWESSIIFHNLKVRWCYFIYAIEKGRILKCIYLLSFHICWRDREILTGLTQSSTWFVSFCFIYGCAVSWLDVDSTRTTSCVTHSMLIGIITHSEVKLW